MANAAVLILYDKKKNILLQRRDAHAPKYPHQWGFFGGAIETRETPEEAVRREAQEELDFRSHNFTILTVKEMENEGTKHFFAARCDNKQTLRLREGDDMRWFTIQDALRLNIVPHHKEVLQDIVKVIENLP